MRPGGDPEPRGADPSAADPHGADPRGADPRGADPPGADPHAGRPDLADPETGHRGAAPSRSELPDHDWNLRVRDETDQERLDRNFAELLQELRVAQAGVQILFAFLLSLAFTQRFGALTRIQRDVYIAALIAAAVAAALFIAPVAWHRLLFRRRRKHELVDAANWMALAGLTALLVSIAAAVLLIVDVTVGPVPAVVVGGLITAWNVVLWYALPVRSRFRDDD